VTGESDGREARLRRDLDAARAQLLRFAEDFRDLYRQERRHARDVERVLEELDASCIATMETLAQLVEAKDADTRRHLDRTSAYAVALARLIDPDLAERPHLLQGFHLHDIGKVGVSERILTKPGPLHPSEWAEMRTHPVVGAEIVSPIRFLGDAIDVIRFHHERFDGSGYPDGLAGDGIPLPARIFAVVDAFDAMTSERPYRRAMPAERAVDEITRCSGTQFDPEVVEPFLAMAERMLLPATAEEEHSAAAG
jgi:HD-GYP domain-containing protein (c-di-GMP phosphodiesterase class II)